MPKKKVTDPAIEFPIKMDVQYGSKLYHKKLDAYDTVRCIKCGQKFQINRNTVKKVGSVICVLCPNKVQDDKGKDYACGYYADVLYYFDRVVV